MFSKTYLFIAVSSIAFAASPAIGIVTASGHFSVDHSEIWGNSTLFDGATVETGAASSELALRNGVKLQLGAESRAKVFASRLVLEKGIGQVSATTPYEIDAAGLRIHGTRLRIGVSDRVEVAALAGSARVENSAGLLLASIPSGRSMGFGAQTGSNASVTRTGCLMYKDGHFILQDDNTQEVVELTGTDPVLRDLRQNTGNRVEVTGTASGTKPAVAIATLLLTVNRTTLKSTGGCLSVASALDARTEAPPANASASNAGAQAPKTAGGGMSTGAKIAIIGAIAGGGAGAALALAGKKSSTSP